MTAPDILSRHRLVHPYRIWLATLWLALPVTLCALVLRHEIVGLLNPRLWLVMALAIIPAWHVWRQGIDTRTDGLLIRIYAPQLYAYDMLDHWHIHRSEQGHILIIVDRSGKTALSFHAAHLTDIQRLLSVLRRHVRQKQATS